MDEAKVSIIIPAYNAADSLGRCLKSVQEQTYRNFEAIIINDGSKDETAEISRRFCAEDPRFLFLDSSENHGVSESRNSGIAAASGKYLQFIDSDDWMAQDATEKLVKGCESIGCELAVSDFYRVIKKKIWIKGDIQDDGIITRDTFARHMMDAPANFYYGVLWNKMYQTAIVKGFGLKCSEELDWCEDLRFNLEYLLYVQNVYVITSPTYYYVKRNGSLSDVESGFRAGIRVKRKLYEYYRDLYEASDLYEKNRLKIQRFYFDFARDKTKGVLTNYHGAGGRGNYQGAGGRGKNRGKENLL